MKKYFCLMFLVSLLCSCGTNGQDISTSNTKASANSIFVISPYKYQGTWVFDDPRVGLVQEPFVAGIPEMMDRLVKDIPNADKGFRLLFSVSPFPGYTIELVWKREERGGNWYFCKEYDSEGWLCPALFKYFDKAPKKMYAKAEKK